MSDVFEVPPADVPAPPPEQPPVPVSAPEATNEYDALLAEAPKAKPAGNEYDAVVVDLKRERQQRLRATGIVAQGSTPEAAAKAVSLSAKTGLPADLVERNLPKVAGEQKLNEYDALVTKSPKLADWLTADPINAKVASSEGDFSKLSRIEEGVNEIRRGVLGQQASSGFAGWKSASRKLGDLEAALGKQAKGEYLSPWDRAMIGQEEVIRQTMKDAIINYGGQFYERGEQAAAIPMRPVVEEMQKAGAKGDWGGVWEALKQDPLGAIYSISMQSAYLLPFQIGAFAAAGPAGAFGVSFLAEYMGAVTDAMQEAGVNIADPTQVTKAFADPAMMEKIEKQAAIKAAVIGSVDAASLRVARVPLGVGKRAVTREGTNLVAQMGVQAAAGAGGEAAGSALAGMKVDPFAVVSEALGEMGTAPVEVATTRWMAAVQQDATREQFEKFQKLPALERIAIGQALVVDRLIEQAANTKIGSLSPEKLQEFIGSITEAAQSVFVPASAVASYLQDMTGLQARQFVEKLGIADQIERARVSGEDIAIPLANYVMNASEAHKAWRNDIRTEVDGFSVRQAHEWETRREAETQAAMQRFEEQIVAGLAEVEPRTRVYQSVLENLRSSGQLTNEVAAQHAALYAAHYHARAARNPGLYTDAFDAYEKAGTGKGVTVRSELPESIRVLGPDRLDVMLDSIRSGKDPVKLDAHVEAKKAATAGPKTPKQQAGETTEAAMRSFRETRQALADALAGLGIDVSTASNARIRKALEEAAKPGGRTYEQAGPVDSAAFKKWFRDSKVVDADGKPVVVYHGTDKKFSAFNPKKSIGGLIWFTNDRAAIEAGEVGAAGKGQIMDLYASIQNPAGWAEYDKYGIAELQGRGYDGVILPEKDGTFTGIAFEPTQVKSASRNRGTFDPNSPRIYNQEARGSISFAENGAIIRLFQGRDLSTLIHESGHLFLAELEFDAKAPNASEDTKAMWQSVLDFVGSKDGYITVEQHELFARAFEAYTMEGKAPSEGLRAAFRSFKNWLVTIYRTLARLNAPLSPEMRQVFDRLLATDEEIAGALNTQGLNPLFADAKSAEMTEAEFKAYTANMTRVVDEAEQKVLTKVMAQIRREKTKEMAAEKARIRKEVTAELMADPGQGALHFLRNGKLYEGETPEVMLGKKLSRPDLVALIGEDGLNLLPKGVYAEEGLSPDDVAQQFGLGNGTELTERLMQIQAEQDAMRAKGDNRSVVNVRVAEETQRRLTEIMGDPLNDGSIEAEAMAAVHSDKQGALMASELKVLARKAGHSGVISLDNIREWAKTAIGEMSTYQGTQFAKYQQAERVAGQKVQRALVKGDFMAAFKAKQDQLVNFALYQEAKKAADDTEKARKLADRYASARTIPNMDQEALDAIHEVLEEYDFKKRSGKLLAERTLFNAWAAEQAKAGHVVLEPPRLKGAQSKHFSQMTVDEIRGLHDAIAQMAHLGRLKKELIVNGEKRALDSLLTEMEDAAGKIVQRGVTQFREGETNLQEILGDWRHQFTDARSSLIKMERLFEILDGDKTGRGIFSTALFKPMAEAQVADYDMKLAANKAVKAIYDKVPKEQRKAWATRHSVPDLQAGLTLTKEQIMALAMNVGNASNLDKVLRGRNWSQTGVMATLDKHLTQEEWAFVQDIWDHIDSYWSQIEALEKDVNGFAPKKVEATPVQTKFSTLRGGYYPMEYNRHASFKADRIARIRETTAAVGELFAPGRAKPSTRAGSTHERTENFNAPVLLSLNVIHNHVNEVTQDIAYRKAVMQIYKIITHERFRGAVQAAVGPEYEGQILPWLQRIANEAVVDKVGMAGLENLARTMRLNVSIVGMGLRITTMLQQTVGYSNSVQRIGEAAMANGARLFATNPKQMTATVFAKSGEMRHRANNIDRDMRANMKRFTGKEGVQPAVARFAFKGIAMFDLAVTLPTWLGAYHQGLDQKMTEQEAIYYADKMVRDTQGAGASKDLSSIQNGNEFLRWMTMFFSYANVLYNAQLGLWTDARYGKMTPKLFASLMHQLLYLMIIPPLLSALITGNGPDDDEDWTLWAARNVGFGAFQGLPFLRDVAGAAKNAVEGKFSSGVKLTPVAGIPESAIRLAKDAAKLAEGEPTSKTSVKNLFNMAGFLMGLPLGQPGLTAQFIVDASTGVENPEDLWDWVRGLTIGPEKKK